MNEWRESQFYDDGRIEYDTYIGNYSVKVIEVISNPRRQKRDHWRYEVHHPSGYYATGHKFPWSAEQAKTYVILGLAARALSRVLRNLEYDQGGDWVDEDAFDRV